MVWTQNGDDNSDVATTITATKAKARREDGAKRGLALYAANTWSRSCHRILLGKPIHIWSSLGSGLSVSGPRDV